MQPVTACLCALLISLATSAQAPAAQQISKVLPNGLRLTASPRTGISLVAIDIWVRAGSGMEREDEAGCAHFLEHMLFKGTARRKPGEIDAAIEDLGATLNAGTLRDGAHVYTTVASKHLETALEVLADTLRNPALDAAEMERERPVILDELARSRGDWKRRTTNLLFGALFPKHGYGRPILGDTASITALKRETLAAFHHRLYKPSNVTVAIAGDVTPQRAEELVTRMFGDWAGGDGPTEPLPSKVVEKPTAVVDKMPEAGLLLGWGWRGPAGTDREAVTTMDVIWQAVSDPRNGIIASKLSEKGVKAEVWGEWAPLRAGGMASLVVRCTGRDRKTVEAVVDTEIQHLRETGLTALEVSYLQRALLGSLLVDHELLAGIAYDIGFHTVLDGPEHSAQLGEMLRSVTPVLARDTARLYLKMESAARVALTGAAP
jgi:zinc protease